MVSGEEIDIIIDEEYRAGQGAPRNKEEIYSAMIVLGFLSYYDGYLKIPNKELMKEFEKALKDESFGYVSTIIENSKKMLKATVNGDTDTIESILHDIHNSEIPILQYNDENSLCLILAVAICYDSKMKEHYCKFYLIKRMYKYLCKKQIFIHPRFLYHIDKSYNLLDSIDTVIMQLCF